MKKIGIISDSHHSKENLIKLASNLKDFDMILHLGDNIADCEILRQILDVEVNAVLGNCDTGKAGLEERVIKIEDRIIFMTHGHRFNVKHSLNALYYKALEVKADIVLFGHTHYALSTEENNIKFFNPGSITSPRGRKEKTYGILEIDERSVKLYHEVFL